MIVLNVWVGMYVLEADIRPIASGWRRFHRGVNLEALRIKQFALSSCRRGSCEYCRGRAGRRGNPAPGPPLVSASGPAAALTVSLLPTPMREVVDGPANFLDSRVFL